MSLVFTARLVLIFLCLRLFLAGPAVVFSLVDLARIMEPTRAVRWFRFSLFRTDEMAIVISRSDRKKKKKRKYPKIRLEDFFLFCFSDIFGVELMLGREPAIIIIFQFL